MQNTTKEKLKNARSLFSYAQYSDARKVLESVKIPESDKYYEALNSLLGAVYFSTNETVSAVHHYENACRANPGFAKNWQNLGVAQAAANLLVEAAESYQNAAALGEDSPEFLLNWSAALSRLGFKKVARGKLERARNAVKDDGEIAILLAEINLELLDNDSAADALADWQLWVEQTDPELLIKAVGILIEIGDSAIANLILKRMDTRGIVDPVLLRLIRALLFERNNQVEEASALLSQIPLRKNVGTHQHQTLFHLANAKISLRRGAYQESLESWDALLSLPSTGVDLELIWFNKAKIFKSQKKPDTAINALNRAHEHQVSTLSENLADSIDLKKLGRIKITEKSVCEVDFAGWKYPTESKNAPLDPIFIVGFPRSGTTLLEQCLDSHAEFYTLDEKPYLQEALESLNRLSGYGYPTNLSVIKESELEKVRVEYWNSVEKSVGRKYQQRLVDKNPMNILRLPAIKILFPHAHVIHLRRHPLDVILSCFFQHFRAPEFVMMCSSLDGIAEAYEKAITYFAEQQVILKCNVLEVKYEDFVENIESEVDKLCAYLGVVRSPEMLEPSGRALSKGFISTPSYSQVVHPVNTKAIGVWRDYEKHLGNARDALRQLIERLGYSV